MQSFQGLTIESLTSGRVAASKPPAPLQQPAKTVPQPFLKQRISQTPIIVVPSSNLSLITLLNATDVLQELKFVSNEQMRAKCTKRKAELLIHRRRPGGSAVPYKIVDNPLKLTTDDWQRVVAVFVAGPAWQFKGWPISGGDPVQIFSKSKLCIHGF